MKTCAWIYEVCTNQLILVYSVVVLNSGSECALYGAPVMALTIFFCVILSFDIYVSCADSHKIMP